MTIEEAATCLGDRLGLVFGVVVRSARLDQADVTLGGDVVGRLYGNDDDGYIFQMAVLPADRPGSTPG